MFSFTEQENVLELSLQTKLQEVIERSNKTNKQINQEHQSKNKTVKV